MFKTNEGGADRALRVVAAIRFIMLAATGVAGA